jgi:dihydrofolate reductase
MRKIVYMMSMSLDGYMETPEGSLDWHRVDDEVHAHFNELLRGMGAFLEGRVTYELMEEFWPTADEDPANAGPMAEFAGIWRGMPKIVYSKTLQQAGSNTTIVREVSPEQVHELKAQPGGDLALGGARLAETFLRYGLVDEIRAYVHPVVLGRGNPMFRPTGQPTDLRLVETQRFGNGVVLLRYARAAA